MKANYALLLKSAGGESRQFELAKAEVLIGRSSASDIVLSDSKVSRGHARLECGPEGCTLVDLGSANGVRVNGKTVTRQKLAVRLIKDD